MTDRFIGEKITPSLSSPLYHYLLHCEKGGGFRIVVFNGETWSQFGNAGAEVFSHSGRWIVSKAASHSQPRSDFAENMHIRVFFNALLTKLNSLTCGGQQGSESSKGDPLWFSWKYAYSKFSTSWKWSWNLFGVTLNSLVSWGQKVLRSSRMVSSNFTEGMHVPFNEKGITTLKCTVEVLKD